MNTVFTRVDGCDLCRAARITPWHYEDDICWIAECEICEVPMVVWRYHGTTPPDQHVAHTREDQAAAPAPHLPPTPPRPPARAPTRARPATPPAPPRRHHHRAHDHTAGAHTAAPAA